MDAVFLYGELNMMIRLIIALIVVMLGCFEASALMVERFIFSTTGNDCYSDGSPVLTNECYALVWQRKGTAFPGLPLVPALPPHGEEWLNRDFIIAKYFPFAEHDEASNVSRCDEVWTNAGELFTGYGEESTNGTWTVYLLDTRFAREDGTYGCGYDWTVTNAPNRINAYAPVKGLVGFTLNLTRGPIGGTTITGGDPSTPTIANQPTYRPESLPTPRFSDVRSACGENGQNVRVCVTNTAMSCQYRLSMVDDLDKLESETNFVGEIKWGSCADPLIWEIPIGNNASGFFRIIRLQSFFH